MTDKSENLEKEDLNSGFISNIDQLEKNLSSLRVELEEFSEKDALYKEEKRRTKDFVEKIILGYKKKLSLKEDEMSKLKRKMSEAIAEYDNLLKKKDFEIVKLNSLLLQKSMPDEELLKKGVPKELAGAKKEEVIINFMSMAKENLALSKKLEELKKKAKQDFEYYKTSMEASESNFDKLAVEFSKVYEKNQELESEISSLNQKFPLLLGEVKEVKDYYEKKLLQTKADFEKRVDAALLEKTKTEVSYQVGLKVLEGQLEEYRKKILDEEKKREEVVRNFEEKARRIVSQAISPLIGELIKDYDAFEKSSVSKDIDWLYDFVKESILKGDTKEKIFLELEGKGFSKSEISGAINSFKE